MGKADKRQRQRENRAERRAREEREERRRRAIRFAIRAAVVVAIVIGAGFVISMLTGDDGPADTTQPATTTTAAGATTTTLEATTTTQEATTTTQDPEALSAAYLGFRELPVACGGTAPPPVMPAQFDAPEDQGLAPDGTVTATVTTSCGDLVIELDPSLAPDSVNSFVFLARQDYFDGVVSHRLVPGFVVQIGDPTATGAGGPGYNIVDEFPQAGFAYDRGVVAMAKTPSPDSTGSQFFVGLGDTGLDPEFNPIGRLVNGFDALDRIEQIPVDGQRPLEALYIEDVVVEGG